MASTGVCGILASFPSARLVTVRSSCPGLPSLCSLSAVSQARPRGQGVCAGFLLSASYSVSSDHSMETEEEVIPPPPVVSDPVTPVPISSQRCHKCNRRGHFARECPNIVCFNCDNLGHTSNECPKMLYW